MSMPYYYGDHELFPIVEIYHDVIPYLAGISMHTIKMCHFPVWASRDR